VVHNGRNRFVVTFDLQNLYIPQGQESAKVEQIILVSATNNSWVWALSTRRRTASSHLHPARAASYQVMFGATDVFVPSATVSRVHRTLRRIHVPAGVA